jgi:3-carboxy-cis,cis-muconate cycloisomerase
MAERVTTALADDLGRLPAHDLVTEACAAAVQEGRSLLDALRDVPHVTERLDAGTLARLLDPVTAAGNAGTLVDRALEAHSERST